jgi:hypothetical protein
LSRVASASPSPSATTAGAPLSGTVPVVTLMSRTVVPAWTRLARAVDAVLPCFSHSTRTSAGASWATRRKLAVVATGWGFGESSSTARSTCAISAPPFTAGGVDPPAVTTAKRWSGTAS